MQLEKFLDSTYLKTPEQASLSEEQTLEILKNLTNEAIINDIFAVMIRPDFVKNIRAYTNQKKAEVKLGTVIGFPEGTFSTDQKIAEAQKAILDGADELDFVINYEAYKKGETELVKNEFLKGTSLCLENNKVVKWIIEIAALDNGQIANISSDISKWAEDNFEEDQLQNIFIKSSTGFYVTENGKPNGATVEGIKIMLKNAGSLSVKAAGGVKNQKDAEEMIDLGVRRIGTSSAMSIINGEKSSGTY